jgi:hypothetical protein
MHHEEGSQALLCFIPVDISSHPYTTENLTAFLLEATMSYNVYTAEYIGSPNHVRLYVETDSSKKMGLVFHVIGNILMGMTYEKKIDERPDTSVTYVDNSMVRIGSVEATDLARFELACEAVPVPGKQLTLIGTRLDPSKPVRRCGEWVQDAKEKLLAEGIVRK